MSLGNQFNKSKPAGAGSKKGVSRYAGIAASNAQAEFPSPGDYIFEVVSGSYEYRPSDGRQYYKATLRVVESEGHEADAPETETVFLQFTTPAGIASIRDLFMACHGYDDVDEFDAWAKQTPDETVEAVEGQRFMARVSLGKPDGKGGHYRNWTCAPATG